MLLCIARTVNKHTQSHSCTPVAPPKKKSIASWVLIIKVSYLSVSDLICMVDHLACE